MFFDTAIFMVCLQTVQSVIYFQLSISHISKTYLQFQSQNLIHKVTTHTHRNCNLQSARRVHEVQCCPHSSLFHSRMIFGPFITCNYLLSASHDTIPFFSYHSFSLLPPLLFYAYIIHDIYNFMFLSLKQSKKNEIFHSFG